MQVSATDSKLGIPHFDALPPGQFFPEGHGASSPPINPETECCTSAIWQKTRYLHVLFRFDAISVWPRWRCRDPDGALPANDKSRSGLELCFHVSAVLVHIITRITIITPIATSASPSSACQDSLSLYCTKQHSTDHPLV